MWNVGCGMWDVGCGMWDVARGMWHVAAGRCRVRLCQWLCQWLWLWLCQWPWPWLWLCLWLWGVQGPCCWRTARDSATVAAPVISTSSREGTMSRASSRGEALRRKARQFSRLSDVKSASVAKVPIVMT